MKKLKRMKLINWHRFENCVIDFGETTLLSGENGAGKTTILDAIQFVVICSANFFNKAAHDNGNREDPQSYAYYMRENLFSHVNIRPEKTFLPDGREADSQKACEAYNQILRQTGQQDLQLLGIGHDGHIGFNEPADHFPKETHCVDLAEPTIEANARFFESREQVPTQAYTMGIQNIMAAKQILMVANGKGKAKILKEAFQGPITPQIPASILQLHPNVILVADEEALSEMESC